MFFIVSKFIVVFDAFRRIFFDRCNTIAKSGVKWENVGTTQGLCLA